MKISPGKLAKQKSRGGVASESIFLRWDYFLFERQTDEIFCINGHVLVCVFLF